MMAVVILVAALIISAGVITGMFDFQGTLPIYILLILIVPAWYAARRWGWRWLGFVPVVLCFSLGVYGSLGSNFLSNFILFYALAVLLSGTLLGNRAVSFWVIASTLTYTVLGLQGGSSLLNALPYIIIFFFALVGIALLQGYTYSRMRRGLEAQMQANVRLQAEIARREESERVQRDQESQLRRLAENTTDLILEMDANGLIRYASPSHRPVLDIVPESLLGTNAFDLVHPDDLPEAFESAQRAAEQRKSDRIQLRVRHNAGHFLYVEISGTPLFDDQGQLDGYMMASRDISAQKQAEGVIQESEKKFRNIIESLPLGIHIFTLLEDSTLLFSGFNPAANEILHIDHAALVNMPIEAAFPGLIGTELPERFREIARLGGTWDCEQVPYDQGAISGTFEVHAFQTSPGKMVAVFTEITERIRAADALRVSEEKFSTAFVTSPDSININRLSDGVYLDINQGFTKIMGFTREDVLGVSSLDLNIWADPVDRVRLVKELQETGEVSNLEARFQRKNGSITVGLMSARVITIQGEVCILSVTRDIEDRIQSEMELREAHTQLEQAYVATLKGWARALALRENETADHSQRVVEYTLQIAQKLGIQGEALTQIQRGALLHDIGKMGVPDGILLKPGHLTPDEWVTMRQHAEFARAMLIDIDYLRSSIDIPYCHHEQWDGSGYPRGLKGEEIPLAARIFAVVDVYDALIHDRPYRPAWSRAEARRYLVEQRGLHFDPAIVDLFLQII